MPGALRHARLRMTERTIKADSAWSSLRAEIERQVRVTGKKLTPTAAAFAAKHRDDPRAIAKYLNGALSTGDPVLIAKAIGNMVRAQGVAKFAQKAGMRRDSLYRTFNGETSPALDRVMTVLLALDMQLMAKPSAGLSRSG